MILIIAIVIGYVLGILPFVIPKFFERLDDKKSDKKTMDYEEERNKIFDEWLNGAETNNKEQVNQEDIIHEYFTGEIKKGE